MAAPLAALAALSAADSLSQNRNQRRAIADAESQYYTESPTDPKKARITQGVFNTMFGPLGGTVYDTFVDPYVEKTRENTFEAPTYDQLAMGEKDISQYGYAGDLGYDAIDSEFGNVDPAGRDAQLAAMRRLEEINAAGGLTAADRVNLDRINSSVAAQERGAREALMANAAARGLSGSGVELSAQMANTQAAANRRAQDAAETKALAEERAMQAIIQGGAMGSNLRGQDMSAAAAQDAIAQFNARNSMAARESNLGRRQDQMNMNTQQQNQRQYYNRGAVMDAHRAQADLAGQRANASLGVSDRYGDQSQRSQSNAGQLMQGAALYGANRRRGGYAGDQGTGSGGYA